MGLLVEGEWRDQWYDTASHGGRFVRPDPKYRSWIGPGEAFPAQSGRYHLYVSLACPWAHRTLIMRRLKGLAEVIGVSVVHPHMGEYGWSFAMDAPGATGDRLYGLDYLHQLYIKAKPDYTGRVTVPTLWDTETESIVNNESADILLMLNSAFDDYAQPAPDYYPEDLRSEIDALNAAVYDRVNNGVYKTGFATTQLAYEEAVTRLFEQLDALEERLARHRYLCGERVTIADWRLLTTLLRFDPVYVGHFKCNIRRLLDYPNLWGYTRELYQVPGVAATVSLEHIKRHYYTSHPGINPSGIVPVGPVIDFDGPPGRAA